MAGARVVFASRNFQRIYKYFLIQRPADDVLSRACASSKVYYIAAARSADKATMKVGSPCTAREHIAAAPLPPRLRKRARARGCVVLSFSRVRARRVLSPIKQVRTPRRGTCSIGTLFEDVPFSAG